MKKSFKITVDCANCANRIEQAVREMPSVNDCVVNFMTQKMKVELDDDVDEATIKQQLLQVARKIEPDFEME